MKYSHSKLEIIRRCLNQYNLKYECELDVDEDTEYLNFGNLNHDIAEHYNGGGKKEILMLYNKVKPQYEFDMEIFKPRLKVSLSNIHSFWKHNLQGANWEPEQEIVAQLNDEISLVGKVDVIIYNGDRVRLIDYKTNKSQKYADHTNQLAMYMFLVHSKYGIPYEKMDCEIVYLSLLPQEKDGTEVLNEGYNNIHKKYSVDDSDVAVLLEEIEAIHHRVLKARKKNIWKSYPSWFNCTFCPFSKHCDDKFDNSD